MGTAATLLSLPQLGLSLTAGTLTTLSPCVFPMLPLVAGGALHANRFAPLAMGLGMVLSFATMGMALGALGPALGIDSDQVRWTGGAMLVFFAMVMLVPGGSERMARALQPLANSAHNASAQLAPESLRGALALGAVLGLVWSPCSGPLLGSVLTLVASEGAVLPAGLMLAAFGLGAAWPLVAVAYASRRGFERARAWLVPRGAALHRAFALLLGALGLAILLGWDKRLEALLVQWMPQAWIDLTVAL